jgi:hypothetical protein
MVLTLVMAACGIPATAPPADVAAEGLTTVATVQTTKTDTTTTTIGTKKSDSKVGTSQAEGKTDFECPVTIPPQPLAGGFVATEPENVTYSEHFPAPDPWPRHYPHEGSVWYGSEGLWTALPVDGEYLPRKSVWWSVDFPGGMVEERPDVSVTWTRLDTDKSVVIGNSGKATNAFTGAEGWFMIAGFDPTEAGCWQVEASYKGTTLSYVYEKLGAQVSTGSTQAEKAKETEQKVVETKPSAVSEETFGWPKSCPVTVLGMDAFTPASETPEGPPEMYDAGWYGTPELYTMINPDGESSENRWLGGEKTFWWSANFSISTEPEPDIEVTARRLDGEKTYEARQTTHGMRDDIGSFMLVGVTLPEPGCWEISASYHGAPLSYVIWVGPNT